MAFPDVAAWRGLGWWCKGAPQPTGEPSDMDTPIALVLWAAEARRDVAALLRLMQHL